MDIHYIMHYITYKRYNYIYINTYIYIYQNPRKLLKTYYTKTTANFQTTKFPLASSRILIFSFLALLDIIVKASFHLIRFEMSMDRNSPTTTTIFKWIIPPTQTLRTSGIVQQWPKQRSCFRHIGKFPRDPCCGRNQACLCIKMA